MSSSSRSPVPWKSTIENSEVKIEAVKATKPYYQKTTKSILGSKRSTGRFSASSSVESTGCSPLISRIKCGKGHSMEVIDVARDKWKASVDCAKCQAKELEKLRRFVSCRSCFYYLCTKCMYLERAVNRKSGMCRAPAILENPRAKNVNLIKSVSPERFVALISEPVNGVCHYLQTNVSKYLLRTGVDGWKLLEQLILYTTRLLNVNNIALKELPERTSSLLQRGQQIYQNNSVNGSRNPVRFPDDCTHCGFHRWFIDSESIPRFTKTWSMLEGAIATGVIVPSTNNLCRIACIGGGPGFEQIACKLFFKRC